MSDRRAYYAADYQLRRAIAHKEADRSPDRARARIAECRAAGMTIQQIARMAGLHYKHIEHIERRSVRVRPATERAILAVHPRLTPAGVVRRMQALAALGWTASEVAAVSGMTIASVKWYRRNIARTVPWDQGDAAGRAYDALAMRTPPDKPTNRRTRTMARANGWLPPLAWDDIDDPAERGDAGGADLDDLDEIAIERAISGIPARLTAAERREVVRILAARGLPDSAIADRCCVNSQTIYRDRVDLGIESRWAA